MAYINGNYTCFTPALSLGQVDAKLQTKAAPLLIEGETVIQPDAGFDALSEVTVSGVYYSEKGLLYTKKMRLKTHPTIIGENLPNLEELIIDSFMHDADYLEGFSGATNVHTITFVNSNCVLENAFAPFDSAETIIFESVGEYFAINIWGDLMGAFTHVKTFEVFEGWEHDLVLLSAYDLEAESIINIINNLATVDYRTLWLGSHNIEKVDPEIINNAVNKGWDVM